MYYSWMRRQGEEEEGMIMPNNAKSGLLVVYWETALHYSSSLNP